MITIFSYDDHHKAEKTQHVLCFQKERKNRGFKVWKYAILGCDFNHHSRVFSSNSLKTYHEFVFLFIQLWSLSEVNLNVPKLRLLD